MVQLQGNINLYIRLAEVVLGMIMILYQLENELSIHEIAMEYQERIIATSHSVMIVPILFRLEVTLFEREELGLGPNLFLVILGLLSYILAGSFTLFIWFSYSSEDWQIYDTAGTYKYHVGAKTFLAFLMTVLFIVDLVAVLVLSKKEIETPSE